MKTIKRAVIILDELKPEVFYVDENNKRASENKSKNIKTTLDDLFKEASALERELRRKEFESRQGSLGI